jgi:nicotinamide mononucleotide adenylyltransferase
MFDWQKPTAMMLGRWQPWHDGHTELFCRALSETGQVAILIRDVGGIIGRDAGAGRTNVQEDNPFSAQEAIANIEVGLEEAGFTNGKQYIIMMVPNIVDISFGRGVGYTFTEHDLGKSVENISATKIRAKMREEGTL